MMQQIQVRPANITGPTLNRNTYKEIHQLYKTTTSANLKNRDDNIQYYLEKIQYIID